MRAISLISLHLAQTMSGSPDYGSMGSGPGLIIAGAVELPEPASAIGTTTKKKQSDHRGLGSGINGNQNMYKCSSSSTE